MEQERNNNALAADILNKWRTEGRLRQNQDGEVSIIEESELPEGHPSKRRPQEAEQNMDWNQAVARDNRDEDLE